MKTAKNAILILILIVASWNAGNAQGFNIKIKINGLKNASIILGHYFNDKLYPDDTTDLDNSGVGYFKGTKPLPGGMYVFFLPNKSIFEVILDKDQDFYVENDTVNFDQKMKIEGSQENTLLYEYKRSNSGMYAKHKELQDKRTAETNPTKQAALDEEIRKLADQRLAYMTKIVNENPNLFFTKFLTSLKEPEVPQNMNDAEKYYYYVNHFFDNFDVSDPRLLRTPIYQNKIDAYLKLLQPIPDSIIPRVDWLVAQAKKEKSEELQRFMLAFLFNNYSQSKLMIMENVYIHIAQKYYIGGDAPWYGEEDMKKLKEKVRKTLPNMVTKVAPELKMQTLPSDSNAVRRMKETLVGTKKRGIDAKANHKGTEEELDKVYVDIFEEYAQQMEGFTSLHQVEALNTILWFWEPSCSHCQEATPKLEELLKKFRKQDLEIYSVVSYGFIRDWDKFTKNIDGWFDFVIKHKLYNFTNVWDVYERTQFRELYDVFSTPTVYLLDKDKKIIAKRIDVEQIEEILMDELVYHYYTKYKDNERVRQLTDFIAPFKNKKELDLLSNSLAKGVADEGLRNQLLKIVEGKKAKASE